MSKKLWFASVPSTLFITTMFVSSTFAWFTDFAVNSGNRVQSGNLAVGFAASDSVENSNLSEEVQDLKLDSDPVFNLGTAAQPGDSQERFLRIRNEGNIAINYQVEFDITVDSRLAEVILFEIQPLGGQTITIPGTEIDQDVYISLQDNQEFTGGLLRENSETPQEFEIWRVKMLYSPSAGNQYNDASLEFEVDIILNAWQFNKFSSPESEINASLNVEDFIESIGNNYSISFEYLEVFSNGGSTYAQTSGLLKRNDSVFYEDSFNHLENNPRVINIFDYREENSYYQISYNDDDSSSTNIPQFTYIDDADPRHVEIDFFGFHTFDLKKIRQNMFDKIENHYYLEKQFFLSIFATNYDYVRNDSLKMSKGDGFVEFEYKGFTTQTFGVIEWEAELTRTLKVKFFDVNSTTIEIPLMPL
jgi:hypothetical protein